MATIPCLYWPVTVAASGMVLRLTRDPAGAPGATTTNTTLTAGTYTQHESTGSIATQLETDFGTVNGVTVAVAVSVLGIVTITVSGCDAATTCAIVWDNSAATQALGTALGFDVSAADSTTTNGSGVATFTGDYQMPRYWTPSVGPRSVEPMTEQEAVVNRTYGGQNTYDVLGRYSGKRVVFEWVPDERIKVESESGTTTNAAIERFLEDDAAPAKFRYWTDRSTLGSGYDDYFLDPSVVERIEPQRFSEAVALYSITLPMWEHTA